MRSVIKHYVQVPELPGFASFGLSAFMALGVSALEKVIWIPVGIMLGVLLLLMTVELVTEYMGMAPSERKVYVWEREISGKIMLLFLVILSSLCDAMLYAVSHYLPREYWFLDNGYMFMTITTIIWLAGAQIIKITTNVAESEGNDNIPPTFDMLVRHIQWVVRNLRRVDQKRMEDAGIQRPPARAIDTLSDADLAEFLTWQAAKKQVDPSALLDKLEDGEHDKG